MIATDYTTQLRRGVVEPCVLGMLAEERMYGWQIAERLIEAGLIGSIGTMYPVLTRLRERGSVSSFEQPSESGPPRRYYELTAQGRGELESFRTSWPVFVRSVSDHIAQGGAEDVRD